MVTRCYLAALETMLARILGTKLVHEAVGRILYRSIVTYAKQDTVIVKVRGHIVE